MVRGGRPISRFQRLARVGVMSPGASPQAITLRAFGASEKLPRATAACAASCIFAMHDQLGRNP